MPGLTHSSRSEDTGQYVATHGAFGTPEYIAWSHMRARCLNPNHRQYKDYGGRGIAICEPWEAFEAFLADMGKRPTAGHSLDRRENDKGYSPENCRWATKQEQNRNHRGNHVLTFNGESKCIQDWADATGIRHTAIRVRLQRGWTVEKALTTPARPYPKIICPR